MSHPLGDDRRMKQRRGTGSVPDELAGFIELGMKKKALAIAGRILDQKSPTSEEIWEAIKAIGVFASDMAGGSPGLRL